MALISSMMRVSAGRSTSLTRWKGGKGGTIDDVVEENVSIEGFEGVFLGKEVEEEQNLLDERLRKIGLRRRVRRAHRVVDELDELLGESGERRDGRRRRE